MILPLLFFFSVYTSSVESISTPPLQDPSSTLPINSETLILFNNNNPYYIDLDYSIDDEGCVITSNDSGDEELYPTSIQLLENEIATDFSISYFSTFKILFNYRDDEVYILNYCGNGKNKTTVLNEAAQALQMDDDSSNDIDIMSDDVKVFDVPIENWSSGLTIPISFLEKIGVIEQVNNNNNPFYI